MLSVIPEKVVPGGNPSYSSTDEGAQFWAHPPHTRTRSGTCAVHATTPPAQIRLVGTQKCWGRTLGARRDHWVLMDQECRTTLRKFANGGADPEPWRMALDNSPTGSGVTVPSVPRGLKAAKTFTCILCSPSNVAARTSSRICGWPNGTLEMEALFPVSRCARTRPPTAASLLQGRQRPRSIMAELLRPDGPATCPRVGAATGAPRWSMSLVPLTGQEARGDADPWPRTAIAMAARPGMA
jgi:hypothetical protein